jgi:uncharacterized phage protein gp47/JayE
MSLEDALETRTPAEVLADVSTDIAARGGDDKSFPETSTAYQILRSYSEARSRDEELSAENVKAGSLSLVEEIPEEDGRDAWIDYQSRGMFANERDKRTLALHVFRLTNAATGVTRTFAPGQLRARFGAVDFLSVTKPDITAYAGSGTLAPGGTLDLLFEAQTGGSVGNVPAGYVTQLVTVFAGVSVSNPAIAGTGSSIYRAARDDERNASLLDRDVSRWGATSAGGASGSIVEWIHEAFAYAATTCTITKWYIDDTNPDGPGTVRIYLASDSGPATAEELAVVRTYLAVRQTKGTGGWSVLAAIARAISFAATIQNGTNTSAETDSIAVITALNAESPLGSLTLYKSELIERLMAVRGTTDVPIDDLTFENTVLQPGENLVLTGAFDVVT